MSVGDFFRTLDWIGTGRVALLRVFAATIVWSVFGIIMGGASGNAGVLLSGLVAIFLILLAGVLLAVVCGAIARAGVPFIGLVCFVGLPAIVGDPLVWALKKVKPQWVDVEPFYFFNRPFLLVFKGQETGPEDAPTQHAGASVPATGTRKYEVL